MYLFEFRLSLYVFFILIQQFRNLHKCIMFIMFYIVNLYWKKQQAVHLMHPLLRHRALTFSPISKKKKKRRVQLVILIRHSLLSADVMSHYPLCIYKIGWEVLWNEWGAVCRDFPSLRHMQCSRIIVVVLLGQKKKKKPIMFTLFTIPTMHLQQTSDVVPLS